MIANNIVDFVSLCFTLQMEPDFTREAVVRSFVKPFPECVEETLNETPGALVPIYKKCDPDPISFFFRTSLFAIISKYLWSVLNLTTLRRVVIHVDSAEGFLKVLRVSSCLVVILLDQDT